MTTTQSRSAHNDVMKAATVTDFGAALDIQETSLPEPGRHQALVKLIASGVCHTDVHAADGDWPVKPQPPFVPGHEGVGTVVKLGPGEHDVKLGDMVGNAWLWSACGTCEYCRTGRETMCESAEYGGYTVNGSFGEYMLVDTRYAPKIPAGAQPVEVAPILCAGVTVYKGLKNTEVKPGQWVVISGIGGLGHVAVQYAVAMGMRVIALDIRQEALQLAKSLGAEAVVDASEEGLNVGEAVAQITGGGAHGVLVTAVHNAAFGQAIDMARRGAVIVFNGLPPGDFPAPIFDIVFKQLTIRGSLVGTRQDMDEALDFYARGLVKPIVSECQLEDINDVFRHLVDGKVDGRIAIKY
ncbi:alcohol dehydrogenase catalytic domain-containing protein [Corynebacterium poyangense]|uniref:Alcohol dehydrogenase n=1 Tax=Corynebacterium poyangense TaxID=2684405 RepID=A0A7H0SQG5_9CORY|nr:zinc-dependent alcohol dehydrogenase [Corynebacterium poyangense]MBZ8178324.1 alcohol dehydrogenase catalytic domain-containing protein [Corynebacterium poyangense]QNQ90790.1 alcohol dehydrogenase catalytic domain-containing protein [Corynebacterium poyangense]